jgi:peptidoglycan/xylan/chitin deacetylase (PgdA/CDA1 family)
VISLDFELNWGVRDSRAGGGYRANLLGVRQAVPALLDLFERYEIHATWATVGLLFCRSRDEMVEAAPAIRPQYLDARLSPYAHMGEIGAGESADPFHYGASLIERIRGRPFQEIASHTFSHYYCQAPGQNVAAFEADLRASIAIAAKNGIATRSLVFPRNQVNPAYLASCARMGIMAYRGNPASVKRAVRFADSYVGLSGHNGHEIRAGSLPVDVPGSRFLRPYSKQLAALEALRLRRICGELTAAAEAGRVYHLWWHPHNFGLNLGENLAFFEGVLRRFDELRNERGMVSLNMAECAEVAGVGSLDPADTSVRATVVAG